MVPLFTIPFLCTRIDLNTHHNIEDKSNGLELGDKADTLTIILKITTV